MALSASSPRKLRRARHRACGPEDELRTPQPIQHFLKPPVSQACALQVAQVPHWTRHAKRRAAQRNLSIEALGLVLLYGQALHCAGAVIYFLRRRDLKGDDIVQPSWERLIGATVVLDPTQQWVVTVYRNRCGLRRLKRKPPRDMHCVSCD